MYSTDWPQISTFALKSPHNLYRVGCFVLATINQHLENVPGVLRIMDEGSSSKQLSPNTRRGMDALASEAQALYDDMCEWAHIVRNATAQDRAFAAEQTIFRMVQLPGLGIVKSAFYVQLVLGITGCLDRWNLRRAGLDERLFMRVPASATALRARIATYVATCEALGGSETLWDAWSTTLSVERPKRWPDAESVSQFHVTCICGED